MGALTGKLWNGVPGGGLSKPLGPIARRRRDRAERRALGDLGRAISRGEFELHYQPILGLRSGETEGVEALARWRHPERGLLAPDHFIPLIESSDLSWPFTLHVLDMALAQCAAWAAEGWEVPVAVNLSATDVVNPRLPMALVGRLAAHRLPARSLHLEVTESSIIEPAERAAAILGQIAERAIAGIALDDFGTGYSSLARIRELPIQSIKVDRSFVAEMEVTGDDAMVRSIVRLAHGLGLAVIAEGIETADMWTLLAALECNAGQGYFMSRPQPAHLIKQWCDEHDASGLARLSTPEAFGERRRSVGRRADELYWAYDLAPDPVLVLDDEGACVYANTAAAELYGLTPEEMTGRAVWRHLRRSGAHRAQLEVHRPDGSRRQAEFHTARHVLPGHRHLSIGREIRD